MLRIDEFFSQNCSKCLLLKTCQRYSLELFQDALLKASLKTPNVPYYQMPQIIRRKHQFEEGNSLSSLRQAVKLL